MNTFLFMAYTLPSISYEINIFNILPQSQPIQVEIVPEFLQLMKSEWFSKPICDLIISGNKPDFQELASYPLTNKVIVDFHMFGPCMKYWIGSKIGGTEVITPKTCRS
jgi:hypothetical protein